jgi:hypothetical protein
MQLLAGAETASIVRMMDDCVGVHVDVLRQALMHLRSLSNLDTPQ